MDLVDIYVQGKLKEFQSVSYQTLNTAKVISLGSGQQIIIDQTLSGVVVRATILHSVAAKLPMTKDRSLLQNKSTFCPIDCTWSPNNGYAIVTASLLNDKDSSGAFFWCLVLEVLLDTMLHQGKLPLPPFLSSFNQSIWCWGAMPLTLKDRKMIFIFYF